MFIKVHIKRYERGLLLRRGDFIRPLDAGTYRIWFWNWVRDRIEVASTLKTRFEHPLLDVIVPAENRLIDEKDKITKGCVSNLTSLDDVV